MMRLQNGQRVAQRFSRRSRRDNDDVLSPLAQAQRLRVMRIQLLNTTTLKDRRWIFSSDRRESRRGRFARSDVVIAGYPIRCLKFREIIGRRLEGFARAASVVQLGRQGARDSESTRTGASQVQKK